MILTCYYSLHHSCWHGWLSLGNCSWRCWEPPYNGRISSSRVGSPASGKPWLPGQYSKPGLCRGQHVPAQSRKSIFIFSLQSVWQNIISYRIRLDRKLIKTPKPSQLQTLVRVLGSVGPSCYRQPCLPLQRTPTCWVVAFYCIQLTWFIWKIAVYNNIPQVIWLIWTDCLAPRSQRLGIKSRDTIW